MSLIRVERLDESGKLRVSKPLWLAWVGEQMPPLEEVWQLYLRRFTVDHWYRFLKQRLHWTLPKLSTPKQCERWSDLMPIMIPFHFKNDTDMQVAPRLRSATRSRVAEEAISISNFVKWYDLGTMVSA
ncbi:hypothetical protein [Aulosira sp. FACHB-615]|uniref:hypothetical protein n=1 Tax=Aulosira sp. FACHB-615 TaxID=2692777 RepID=UPI001F5586A9|nr:hypothetical protein [Aulosira sp. FACHB-615]